MIEYLKKLNSLIKALVKIVPVLIEVLADLSDNGKLDGSQPTPKANKFFTKKSKS